MRAAVVLALCAACGGGTPPSRVVVAARNQTPVTASSDPHTEIRQLSADIDSERAEMKLPDPGTPTGAGAAIEPLAVTPSQVCHAPPSDKCNSSCRIADHICRNAEKICNLAKRLPGDTWAENQCARANTTCDGAKGQCCGCQ